MSIRRQAISGVSTGENQIMTVYPSICAMGIGRFLGKVYELIPIRIFGIKLSNLLFVLPTAPLALALYGLQKLTGNKYVLTNNAVEIWSLIGQRKSGSVALLDIADAVSTQRRGQEFFHASDLQLYSENGDVLLTLRGLPRSEVFAQTVMKARFSKASVKQSLETIKARQTA